MFKISIKNKNQISIKSVVCYFATIQKNSKSIKSIKKFLKSILDNLNAFF